MVDFRNEACRKKQRDEDGANKKGTALSEIVWELKDKGKVPRITWKVVDRAFPYQGGAKTCDLCRAERLHIALGKNGFTKLQENCLIANKRSEIMNKCPHKRQFTLAMVKPNQIFGQISSFWPNLPTLAKIVEYLVSAKIYGCIFSFG